MTADPATLPGDPTEMPLELRDPLCGWLKANGVDWDRVVAWPEIEFTDTTLTVEQFYMAADGYPGVHPGYEGHAYTGPVEYPLVTPPDPVFWAAYCHTRPIAKRRDELRSFARELRGLGNVPPGATVVMLEGGDSLMFVTPHKIEQSVSRDMVDVMKALLPGVEVLIAGGFDMLMHRKRD